jgi:hypothetical protein
MAERVMRASLAKTAIEATTRNATLNAHILANRAGQPPSVLAVDCILDVEGLRHSPPMLCSKTAFVELKEGLRHSPPMLCSKTAFVELGVTITGCPNAMPGAIISPDLPLGASTGFPLQVFSTILGEAGKSIAGPRGGGADFRFGYGGACGLKAACTGGEAVEARSRRD